MIRSLPLAVAIAIGFAIGSSSSAALARDDSRPAATAKPAPVKPAPVTVQPMVALSKAKAAIAYSLVDPESVRWRRAKISPNGNVCIEVNAKNAYGGYVGFQPYSYEARSGDIADNDGLMAWMWCNNSNFMQPGTILVDAAAKGTAS